MATQFCPLCKNISVAWFCSTPSATGERHYLLCGECDLLFLDPAQRPSQQIERKHYDLHHNVITDEPYCAFLSRLIDPLLEKIGKVPMAKSLTGLDYGSGPGPVMAELLSRAGHQMSIYDPYFAPDRSVLSQVYDFVTCSEVAEHFYDPGAEFRRFELLIRPGGFLALMTGILPDWTDFKSWHYHRDITHVVFYSPKTIAWIGRQFGWVPEFFGSNVVLFSKEA